MTGVPADKNPKTSEKSDKLNVSNRRSDSRMNVSGVSSHKAQRRGINNPVKEYIWAAKLTKENPTAKWTYDPEDEDDADYLIHTLFLRHALLDSDVKDKTRTVVDCETKDWQNNVVAFPVASLTLGVSEMCHLDLNFHPETSVSFRLVQGEGPVHLVGQHMVESPTEDDPDEYADDDDEVLAELDSAEDEMLDESELIAAANAAARQVSGKPGSKRKAKEQLKDKTKRGKMDHDESEESDEEEHEHSSESGESEENMDEDEEDEEEEESPKKRKRSTGSKPSKPSKSTPSTAAAGKKNKKPATGKSPGSASSKGKKSGEDGKKAGSKKSKK